MKNHKILCISLVVIGYFLFSARDSRAYTCSLSFSSPHGSIIQIGDRVTWSLNSDYVSGRSFWYGTKDGTIDVNGADTTLGSSFIWTTDPYPAGSQGYYKRSIIIRDQNNNFICQTGDVYISVVTSATVAQPSVSLSPSSLSFFIQQGGSLPSTQWLQFTVNPNQQIFWSAQSSGGWLSFSPSGSAFTTGGLSIGLNQTATALSPGTYTTNILISPQSGMSPSFGTQSVPVTLTVTAAPTATLSVSPTSLNFTAQQGGSNPPAQVLSVIGSNVSWNISVASTPSGWLSTNLTGGTYVNNGSMYVYANQSGLSAGTYNGTVTISSPANPALNIPVTLTVTAVTLIPTPTPSASLSVSPFSLSFSAQQSGANPSSQILTVTGSNVSWSVSVASTPSGWLSTNLSPGATYVNNGSMWIQVNTSGLAAGAYQGSIRISGNFVGSPLSIPVTLAVTAATSTPVVYIYNLTDPTRNPVFWTGDYLRLAVSKLTPNQTKTIELCQTYLGSSRCDVLQASIDYNGTWRTEFQVLGISLGSWTRWVRVDGVASNLVSYTVVNAPILTPTPAPTPTPTITPTPTCFWWQTGCQPTPTPTLTPTLTPIPTCYWWQTGCQPTPTPTPTPTLTPTPTPTPTPTTTPTLGPIDQSRIYSLSEIFDGDLIRGRGDIAVWIVKIVGEKRYKRWLFGPQIFNVYGHLGFNKVKNVSKETLNKFDTSNLIRKFDDAKVYELTDFIPGRSATRRWIQTLEIFLQRGFDFDSVYIVNQGEFNLYTEGSPLPITKADETKSNLPLTANMSEAMLRFFGR